MTQVLVLWEGYGIEHATWEPILNIPSEFVDRFKGDELPDPDFFDSDVEDDQGHVPQSQYGEVKEKACVRACVLAGPRSRRELYEARISQERTLEALRHSRGQR